MKLRILIAACMAAAVASTASATELKMIIKKNEETLRGKVRGLQSFDPKAAVLPAPRLWVHKRAASQDPAVDWVKGKLSELDLPGGAVEFKPVQLVDSGPGKSQLRYFKTVDQARAQELFEALRERLPDLVLSDFTEQYAEVGWLKAGHFELWLGADVR